MLKVSSASRKISNASTSGNRAIPTIASQSILPLTLEAGEAEPNAVPQCMHVPTSDLISLLQLGQIFISIASSNGGGMSRSNEFDPTKSLPASLTKGKDVFFYLRSSA
jgi:hypothetical protein